MLILPNTTDKLQLITSSAATVDVHVSYADHTLSTDNILTGRQNTAISSATTTDILAVPSSGDTRNAKAINIRNKDASLSCDVTVVYNANGTSYQLHSVTLRPGEMLSYVDGVGFYQYVTATNPVVRVAKLGSDQSNSTSVPTEVSGLTTVTGTGTFHFKYGVLYQAAVTTTGVRFSVNHAGTVTFFVADWYFVDNVATASTAAADQDAIGAAAQVFSTYAARAKSTAGWGTSISVDTANADMFVIIEGLMNVSVDGSIALWHGSEVAAQSTVKAGTSLILTRTGD